MKILELHIIISQCIKCNARIECPHKVSCLTRGGSNYPHHTRNIGIIMSLLGIIKIKQLLLGSTILCLPPAVENKIQFGILVFMIRLSHQSFP